MGKGTAAYDGFFTIAHIETTIPGMPYFHEGCNIISYEPSASNRDTSPLLRQLRKFDIEHTRAKLYAFREGGNSKLYAAFPYRHKNLWFIRDLFRERTNFRFAPLPGLFESFAEYRDTLNPTLPDLHAVQGQIQCTQWYDDMFDCALQGLREGKIRGDTTLLEDKKRVFFTCFPRDSDLKFRIEEALKDPDIDELDEIINSLRKVA